MISFHCHDSFQDQIDGDSPCLGYPPLPGPFVRKVGELSSLWYIIDMIHIKGQRSIENIILQTSDALHSFFRIMMEAEDYMHSFSDDL